VNKACSALGFFSKQLDPLALQFELKKFMGHQSGTPDPDYPPRLTDRVDELKRMGPRIGDVSGGVG